MQYSKRILTAIVVTTLAVSMAACGANKSGKDSAPSSTATATPRGGTLYYLSRRAEFTFETANAQMNPTTKLRWVHRGLTSWLTYPDKDTQLVNDLATNTGTTTDGGKTWTYHLQPGLKYSTGAEIVAQDIKYGVERSFAPAFQGGLNYHKTLLIGGADYKGPYAGKELDSIEVPDKYTIVFHLNQPFGNWPWIVSMPAFAPVPKAADTSPLKYGEHPAASGPYQISSFKQGSKIELTRNPNWVQSTDKIRTAGPDKIEMSLGLNNDTVVQRMIQNSGKDQSAISDAIISPAQFGLIKNDPAIKARLAISPSGYLRYLALNVKRPGLDNLKVRQAINLAVTKQEIQSVFGGPLFGGTITSTLMTAGIPGYTDYNLYDGGPTGDPKAAGALMTEAGVSSLKLRLVYATDLGPQDENEAESIRRALARIGITVTLDGMDSDSLQARTDSGNYDMTINGWGPDFPSGMSNLQPLFAASEIGNGGQNNSRYSNPAVEAAMTAAIAEPDIAKANQMWAAIDKQIMQDAPMVPLITQRSQALFGSNIVNYYLPAFPPFANELVVSVKH